VSAVCWRCIEDEYLQKMIREDGAPKECSLCKRTDENAFGPEELAQLVEDIMQGYFVHGRIVKKFGDKKFVEDDDGEWWEQEGDPLSVHLQEVVGQYLGFEDEIVDALKANESVRPQDGEEPFFDSSQQYVSVPSDTYRYIQLWDGVLNQLKHRRRFFSSSAKELFTDLFKGVENRTRWAPRSAPPGEDGNVVWNLPHGSELYRARICSSPEVTKSVLAEPFKNVGPPPPEKARSGRMNPEGVPVFYGSLDWETSLAETRPALGNDTAVIKLVTTKALRLLDFIRLGSSYARLSYFQPDFVDEYERGAFLQSLQRLISQPIVPGRESDYIITQTLAEYLAHVHEQPFDGILFDSVQRDKGTNIVLFPDVDGGFPLSYVDNSVALYSTRSINYVHEELFVVLMPDGDLFFSRHDESHRDDEEEE
jgi:RES domain